MLTLGPISRGSTKDVLGPVAVAGVASVVFEYLDSYSLLNWGRMPDAIRQKGQAQAVLSAHWFEKLSTAETWKAFSRSPEALALRKSSRYGAVFNEIGEDLQQRGLSTHYLGILSEKAEIYRGVAQPVKLHDLIKPSRSLVVQEISIVPPTVTSVLGRSLCDYHTTRGASFPRAVPLDVVFRFNCIEESPFFERCRRDPGYLAEIGFQDVAFSQGQRWDFPVIELFANLETGKRPVGLSEALAISGLSAPTLQEMLLKTAWVAGVVKWLCGSAGIELWDGKLQWAISQSGALMLIDAIEVDHLTLMKPASQPGFWPLMSTGVLLSMGFVKAYYKGTPWLGEVLEAKSRVRLKNSTDWRKLVREKPAPLSTSYLEIAEQLYPALTNVLTGKNWFPDAWSLEKLAENVEKFGKGGSIPC